MLEPLVYPFMQRALIGGVLVGILASYFGPFIVQRRIAFLGSGLAHASFGGVALGIMLGAQPLWVAAPFTVVVAAAIVWVQKSAGLAADTAIGIFFAVSMALGIVFVYRTDGFHASVETYLFASILGINRADLWTIVGVTAIVAATGPLWWRRWAYATFDESLAKADRLPVERDDYLLAVTLAVAVVVSIKVVGIILMAAFLVIPAATARLTASTFTAMTGFSMAFGVTSVIGGLYISYYADVPTGPAIILLQAALFAVVLFVRKSLLR
ncbi:MAG TPA: metal ABC transporter permease [Gammaproteobacteria bacterium]|jgi:zinc transport system permease protein|nr:metal ABC transporter permease [Candidatus Hydrogenedentota bacterium]HJP35866.1 metal ABC transporter permease [Gammaproteobacteria bacterium]